jgi:hypothetical protein
MRAFIRGGLFGALFMLGCCIINCGMDLLWNVLRGKSDEYFCIAHLYAATFAITTFFIFGGIVGRILGGKRPEPEDK